MLRLCVMRSCRTALDPGVELHPIGDAPLTRGEDKGRTAEIAIRPANAQYHLVPSVGGASSHAALKLPEVFDRLPRYAESSWSNVGSSAPSGLLTARDTTRVPIVHTSSGAAKIPSIP